MREIRTSSSMRGGRKRAFARRACLPLYAAPVPASARRTFFNLCQIPMLSLTRENPRTLLL
jgi:hypothetical protein